MSKPTLFIASDHAGFALKARLIRARPDLPWRDLGPATDARVDYPDFADLVAREVAAAARRDGRERALWTPAGGLAESAGVLVCGSGQGMAIRANRNPAVRAALGWSEEAARLSRAHNDANILCLGERMTAEADAIAALKAFLEAPFEGGRHSDRVNKLSSPC